MGLTSFSVCTHHTLVLLGAPMPEGGPGEDGASLGTGNRRGQGQGQGQGQGRRRRRPAQAPESVAMYEQLFGAVAADGRSHVRSAEPYIDGPAHAATARPPPAAFSPPAPGGRKRVGPRVAGLANVARATEVLAQVRLTPLARLEMRRCPFLSLTSRHANPLYARADALVQVRLWPAWKYRP